jgi:hypothetical protein
MLHDHFIRRVAGTSGISTTSRSPGGGGKQCPHWRGPLTRNVIQNCWVFDYVHRPVF